MHLNWQLQKVRFQLVRKIGNDLSYSCECNDSSATAHDCVKRTYSGSLHYCDGNFCSACSLVVQESSNNFMDLNKKSAIITFDE